jgi:asparagine synthase (glutamine-hydrolysing)
MVIAARDVMFSRGPDAGGMVEFSDGSGGMCFLAHRRLSIQDLSGNGAQPMATPDGRYVIVYNGEVYNARPLREELKQAGLKFRSTSDTEVILKGYALWGEALIERLVGIFAFAIWDCFEHRLFLARDRVGIKPLYYAANEHFFAFASDLRALRHLGLGTAIDAEALSLYLMLGYVPAPRSIWSGIQKVEAGAFMSWTKGGLPSQRQYWNAPDDTDYEGRPEAIEALIDAVVEEQMLSDVPVGLFLSGGLDSSIVASSVARLGAVKDDVVAMTVGFPGNNQNDEAPIAERTAKALGLNLRRLEMSEDIGAYAEAAVAAMDEPLAYNAIVTQAGISQLASKSGLKVVLTGDGGDEVFGGYTWHNPQRQEQPEARRFRIGSILSLKEWKRRSSANKTSAFRSKSPYFDYAYRVFPALRPDEVADILPDTRLAHVEELLRSVLARYDAPRLPDKRRLQRIDLFTFCQDSVLAKVDRNGMAFSVEARPPLLDHRIIEWGLSRPVTDYDDSFPKNAIRQILKKRGLEFLLSEPKRGFSLKNRGGIGQDRRAIVKSRAAELGFKNGWEKKIHKRTDSYRTKMEALYWLSRWHEAHGNNQTGKVAAWK